MEELIVKTSEAGWFTKLVKAYRDRSRLIVVDDAHVGIEPSNENLLQMGKKAGLHTQEWVAVLVALGVAVTGAVTLVIAILDPEPFSKIAFTIGAGTLMVLSGGFGAIRVLTKAKPPNVRVTPAGIEIWWT
jgi:hypothetical protein